MPVGNGFLKRIISKTTPRGMCRIAPPLVTRHTLGVQTDWDAGPCFSTWREEDNRPVRGCVFDDWMA